MFFNFLIFYNYLKFKNKIYIKTLFLIKKLFNNILLNHKKIQIIIKNSFNYLIFYNYNNKSHGLKDLELW